MPSSTHATEEATFEMKAITAIAVAGVGLATSAQAYHFSPVATKFTATGPTTLSQNGQTINCTSKFTGKTNATGSSGNITGLSITGSDIRCGLVSGTNFPWKGKPTGATTGKVMNAEVTSPLGTCGPGTVSPIGLSGGVITFNNILNPGSCKVTGTVTTSPTLSVVP
jgi:hypothetical protein